MRIQYGQILTLLVAALASAHASTLDEVFGGMPQLQMDGLFNDLNPLDLANDKNYFDYDVVSDLMQDVEPEKSAKTDPNGAPQEEMKASTAASTMLPAYCDPPNPCPIGYTTADGCIEDFENSSEFSRRYQATQKCICDTEHMFDCPRQDVQRGPDAIEAVNMMSGLPGFEQLNEGNNPYLDGHKLPVAAKKGNF